ncbi:MAG: hypothetical protein AB1485_01940 [Candidatus Thermoplasmatota archaeon]
MKKRKIMEMLNKKRARRGFVEIIQTLSNPLQLCFLSNSAIVILGLLLISTHLQALILVRKIKLLAHCMERRGGGERKYYVYANTPVT